MCSLHMSREKGVEGFLLSAHGEIPCSQMEGGGDEWGMVAREEGSHALFWIPAGIRAPGLVSLS